MIYENIVETIGRTPVVKIHKSNPYDVNIYVKVESFNPSGSVKDRMSLSIIEDAEKSGALKPGQTVIEASSGNTAIALAMICAVKGYPFIAVMADSFSIERRKLIKAYGGRVVLTPAAERGTGMVKKAEELAKTYGFFSTRQFENMANPAMHMNSTAPEILNDFRGKQLDYFVSGWGTGGTFTGTSKILRIARPECKMVLAEPEPASLIGGCAWASHPIQGWTPDFIPGIMQDGKTVYDELVLVSGAEAIEAAKNLAMKEGIFCGISSGATFASALKIAAKAPKGSSILCMLPDTGERYLSTLLCKDISETTDNIDDLCVDNV
jgi:cysteine synthase A